MPLSAAMLLGWLATCVTKPDLTIINHLNEQSFYKADVYKANETEYGYRLAVKVNAQNNNNIKPFNAILFTDNFNSHFKTGDIIDFTASFKPLTFETDLPDEICTDKIYLHQGISVKAYADTVIISGYVNGITGTLYDIKDNAIEALLYSDLDEDVSAFLAATIFGDTSLLGNDTRNMFSATGLAHILALSGMHVAIIILALYIILFPLTLFKLHNTRIIITIILLWCYAIMTLLSPSVTRAVIMATFVLVSYLIYRQNVAFNALCGAALLILIFNPYSLYNIGFQLSFMAVVGILLLNTRLNPFKQGSVKHKILATLILPLSAVIATSPLVIYHFHQFPVYFLISAPIFTPILTFLITASIFLLVIGIPSGILTISVNFIYRITLYLINQLACLPNANITGLYISPISVILLLSLTPLLAAWIEYKKRIYGVSVIMVIMTVAAIQLFAKKDYPDCEYYFTHNSFSTEIVIKEKNCLHIVTTAKNTLTSTIKNKAEYKYTDYMGIRNIDSLNVVNDSLISKYVVYHKPILQIGNQKIILADNDYTSDTPIQCDILMICRGFRGNSTDLAENFNPDKIILSSDLNHKLRKRYLKELKDAGYNVESMKR